jgi:hypothetical protein
MLERYYKISPSIKKGQSLAVAPEKQGRHKTCPYTCKH